MHTKTMTIRFQSVNSHCINMHFIGMNVTISSKLTHNRRLKFMERNGALLSSNKHLPNVSQADAGLTRFAHCI